MKCFHCSTTIYEVSDETSGNSQSMGVQLTNGNWYCQLCADTIDFIGDFSPVFDIKTESEKVRPIEIKEPLKEITHCINTFYCIKCKETVKGIVCGVCGLVSPLMRKPQTKKKSRK